MASTRPVPTRPTSPVKVGAVRGLILAIATAVVTAALAVVTTPETGLTVSPLVAIVLRTLEAYLLDQRRGQPPQEGALGGNIAAYR